MSVPVKQPITINFARGLDTKTDPFQVGPQNFLALENMVFQTGGRLTKRNGFAQDPTAIINPLSVNLSVVPSNIGVGRLVTAYNQEKVICDGLNLFSLSPSDSSWIYKGRATLASLAQTNINKNINSNSQQDSAQNTTLGWNLFAWVDSVNGLTYNIIDQVTGQVILPATVISANGIKPRCLSNAGNLYIVYYDTSLTQLRGYIINSLVPGASFTVASDINTTTPNFDADVYNSQIYLANFGNSASPKKLNIAQLSNSLVIGNEITKNVLANNCVTIFNDPTGNIWVAYGNNSGAGGGILAFVVNAAVTATVLGVTQVDGSATANLAFNITGCYSTISSQAYIFYDQNISPVQNNLIATAIFASNPAYTQPAVNSSVSILFYQSFTGAVGSTVFIPNGGFYTVASVTAGYQFVITTPSVSPTAGATYTDSLGNVYTVTSSSGTSLFANSTGTPPALSGALMKTSGTGDATITFTSWVSTSTVSFTNDGDSRNAPVGAGINGIPDQYRPGTFDINVYSTVQFAWINFNTLTIAGSAGTPALYANEANLASKAWAYLGIPTLGIVHSSPLQPTYFISNLYNYLNTPATSLNANLAIKICDSEAGGTPAKNILPRVNQQSATAFQIAFLQQDLLFTSTSVSTGGLAAGIVSVPNVYSNSGVVSDVVDFSLSNPSNVVLGNNLHISSGVLLMYDGQNVVEHNFHIYPEIVSAIAQGVGGGLNTGQYGYQVVYEWIDNQGQVHKSSPSPVVSLPVTEGNSVQLIVPFLTLTQKQGSTLVIYRTQVNGSIYFRLLAVPLTPPNLLNSNPPVYTLIDGTADAFLTANEQIYTTGEVENIGPPANFAIFAYKNRLILIPYANPYSYYYSKQVDPGSPVEFSDVFVQNVGTVYGPLTGGARLDDKFILGTATNLLYVVGDGPAASGADNDFSDPIFITSDAGVVNQQSFVYSPLGLFFKSQKGIYLCGRDLSVQYKGAAVEKFNSQGVVGAANPYNQPGAFYAFRWNHLDV